MVALPGNRCDHRLNAHRHDDRRPRLTRTRDGRRRIGRRVGARDRARDARVDVQILAVEVSTVSGCVAVALLPAASVAVTSTVRVASTRSVGTVTAQVPSATVVRLTIDDHHDRCARLTGSGDLRCRIVGERGAA